MSHPELEAMSRHERKAWLAREKKARSTGDWGEWESIDVGIAPGAQFGGWLGHCRVAHRNKAFSVLERSVAYGGTHYAITSLTQMRPTWWEMQRIKNELAGADAVGVEIYPPKGEVVDGADMYHLWVLPKDMLPPHYSLWHSFD